MIIRDKRADLPLDSFNKVDKRMRSSFHQYDHNVDFITTDHTNKNNKYIIAMDLLVLYQSRQCNDN